MPRGKAGKIVSPVKGPMMRKSSKQGVANVNKGKSPLSQMQESDQTATIQWATKRKSIETKEIPKEGMNKAAKIKNTEQNMQKKTPVTPECNQQSKSRSTKATFVEDVQTFNMTIDVDPEDSLYCSEAEETMSHGSEGLEPVYPSEEEEQTSDECKEGQHAGSPQPCSSGMYKSPKVVRKPLTHQQKLHALDLKMKQKMKDIHKIMTEGGLTETVNYMSQCFGLSAPGAETDKDRDRGRTKVNYFEKGKVKLVRSVNTNHNHAIACTGRLLGKDTASNKSMDTTYKNAVEKCNSSSSEDDCIDISDESMNLEYFVDMQEQEPEPPIDRPEAYQPEVQRPREPTPDERAVQFVWDAEAAKAKIFPPTGEHPFQFIAQIDEDYLVVSNHIDELTKTKIVRGVAEIMPKDRVLAEKDGRIELVLKNGKAYWTPASDSVSVNINNFAKWEQAFRIFSEVYTKAHPGKSGELIQYNHIIHSISLSFVWDNVYAYDKEFRIHISKHPERSWAVILQQAWPMKLRDRLYRNDSGGNNSQSNHPTSFHQGGGTPSDHKKGEPCEKYNKGKCNFGASCRYDHKCSYCYKFGHTVLNCRKFAGRSGTSNKF